MCVLHKDSNSQNTIFKTNIIKGDRPMSNFAMRLPASHETKAPLRRKRNISFVTSNPQRLSLLDSIFDEDSILQITIFKTNNIKVHPSIPPTPARHGSSDFSNATLKSNQTKQFNPAVSALSIKSIVPTRDTGSSAGTHVSHSIPPC